MNLHLIDNNADLVKAWQSEFKNFPEVNIEFGDIIEKAKCCVVSPANSYGFMDGGIDKVYSSYFGKKIQNEVQKQIGNRQEGYLPIGASLIVKTGDQRIPYLISAPTMMFPEPVPVVNAYRAMRAILRISKKYEYILTDVFCPGLATGVGKIEPQDAAREMVKAYKDFTTGD